MTTDQNRNENTLADSLDGIVENAKSNGTFKYPVLSAGWATSSILGILFGAGVAKAPNSEAEYYFYGLSIIAAYAFGGTASILADKYYTKKTKSK